jgi:hypothetical protein
MKTRRLIVAWTLCFGRLVIEASWCSPKRCRHRFESRRLLLLLLRHLLRHLRLCELPMHLLRLWLRHLLQLQLRHLLPRRLWLWLQL